MSQKFVKAKNKGLEMKDKKDIKLRHMEPETEESPAIPQGIIPKNNCGHCYGRGRIKFNDKWTLCPCVLKQRRKQRYMTKG